MSTSINEFDIVFISYDEPNADENYDHLLELCPWAMRSHGVWGSDAAHKAAAAMAESDRFITIDADNKVRPDFFNVELDMSKIYNDDVISWAGKNVVNGLVYGNGGIKCWPKHVVERMRTHEAAPAGDKAAQVDFCWNINYVQMNNIYCDVHNNGSPLQAWRAGFREGVKMTLDGGDIVDPKVLKASVHSKNLQRLFTWMSVGDDATNGLWAIYGARLGAYMTNITRTDWDWKNVRDFDWLVKFFETDVYPEFADGDELCANTGMRWNAQKLKTASESLGVQLRKHLDLPIADLGVDGSRFFKAVYTNPSRMGAQVKEADVEYTLEDG
tara:strand:- start:264 stop:1247 length:984 start_codon:yes stop_codon:yes gene_type:complete